MEREKARLERHEQQKRVLEEKQRAERAQRLARIRAEQQRVDQQVRRATDHSGPAGGQGAQPAQPASAVPDDRVEAKRERARRLAEANAKREAALAKQRSVDDSQRLAAVSEQRRKDSLAAESERLKMMLATEKATPAPISTAEEDVEDELMSFLSKKGTPKPAVRKPSGGSATPHKSRLSAAVSQVSKERAQQQHADPNGATRKSRLSMAVAAAAHQKKTPAAVRSKSAMPIVNGGDDDVQDELMSFLSKKAPTKSKPAKPLASSNGTKEEDVEDELLSFLSTKHAKPVSDNKKSVANAPSQNLFSAEC